MRSQLGKKILLMTLVHPDFLPPVYATAQCLRDLNYDITILTFDSFTPSDDPISEGIKIESIGKHHDVGIMERLKLRRKFANRAQQLAEERPIAILSFCTFSFITSLKFKSLSKLIYIALEVADFNWAGLMTSPLSQLHRHSAIRNLHKADLVATPSIQRSAWLAGRSHVAKMPVTVLNSSYYEEPNSDKGLSYEVFKKIVPAHFLNKTILLYTGAVNNWLCIKELVEAFIQLNDPNCVFISTGFKDNEYCNNIKSLVSKFALKDNILLLPYVTREEMLALQTHAHIGAVLIREFETSIKSMMIAPNKVGEYLNKGLFLLGVKGAYMEPIEASGVASLADSIDPSDIQIALQKAIKMYCKDDIQHHIHEYVKNYYCMQVQLKPIIKYLDSL